MTAVSELAHIYYNLFPWLMAIMGLKVNVFKGSVQRNLRGVNTKLKPVLVN
jgi:hypothetical protein